MKLAVIILNYNDAKGTADAVKRAAGFSCFSHIVAVDNASTDDSAAVLKAVIEEMHDERLHFIANARNGGYGYGNNAGVRYAHDELGAEAAVIANPDAVFDEALINDMQRVLQVDSEAAAVGAVMRAHRRDRSGRYQNSRCKSVPLESPVTDNAWSSCRGKRDSRRYIDITQKAQITSDAADLPESTLTGVKSIEQESFTYEEYIASGWMRRSTLQCLLNSGPISRRLFSRYINYPAGYYAGDIRCSQLKQPCIESDMGSAIDSSSDQTALTSKDKRSDSSKARKGTADAGEKLENIGSIDAVSVYAVHGSLLMVAAEKFLAVGGYDEAMFLYGEENVLAEKLHRAGFKTYLLKEGYEHAGSVSITGAGLKAVKRQQLRIASENYYYTHYLDCDESGMNIVRIFQRLVLAETCIAARLHLI